MRRAARRGMLAPWPTILVSENVPAPHFAGFHRILCAVDGSRTTAEVIRQAVALAAPGGALEIVAVTDARGVGPSSQATLSEHRAAAAVASAVAIAAEAGTIAEGRVIRDEDVAGKLLSKRVGTTCSWSAAARIRAPPASCWATPRRVRCMRHRCPSSWPAPRRLWRSPAPSSWRPAVRTTTA